MLISFLPLRRFIIGLCVLLTPACTRLTTERSELYSSDSMRVSSSSQSNAETQRKRANIRLQLAIGYYQRNNMTIALEEIKRAISIDPHYADAYNMRGLIYVALEEPKLAEVDFKQALRLSPNNMDAANNYGWFLCHSRREKEGMNYFKKVLQSRAYRHSSLALNNASRCSLRLKDYDGAQRYLAQAKDIDPQNTVTQLYLAHLAYQKNNIEQALSLFKTAIKTPETLTAEALWEAIKLERMFGSSISHPKEAVLVQELRQRYPMSIEWQAYHQGVFDD